MFDVVRFVNSRFTSNTYVIYSTDSENIWVVDPGDFTQVELWMKKNNKTGISGVLITHAHFDHIYGSNELFERHPSTIFYVYNQIGIDILYDAKKNGSKYTEAPFVMNNQAKVHIITPEMNLWDNCIIHNYFTPGHSEDSMCILLGNMLFTGDTLIKNVRTVTKLKGGSVEKLQYSIDMINSFKGRGLIVYPGHGDSFLLDDYNLSVAVKKRY